MDSKSEILFFNEVEKCLCIRKKHLNPKNILLPDLYGFTRFEMSWKRFHYFYKVYVFLHLCVWHKFCGCTRVKTQERNRMKFYTLLHLNKSSCWLCFRAHPLWGSAVIRNGWFTQRYKTKLHAIVLNTNYFKPIILKFKISIYNSSNKNNA